MKYRNDDDKCYGAAGMALGLAIFDATELYQGLDLDDDGGMGITFSPEFYFCGNPRYNAKDSWQLVYSHFRVSMGLAIANTMCRKMVLDHGSLTNRQRQQLLDAATAEGSAVCQLEPDEVQPIFDQYFSHLVRVFSNADVRRAATRLATELKRQRTFTRAQVAELLQSLNLA